MALGRKRTSRDPRFSRDAGRQYPHPADGPRALGDTVSRLCRYYLECLRLENEVADQRFGSGREDPSDLEPGRQADGQGYTKGLEFELRSLQSIPERAYRTTALGAWVHSRDVHARPADRPPPIGATSESALSRILEVVALNPEQRQAVRQGLSNSLTVITGPPGKSQVVTSLVVNASRQGLTVLFASKNNKAVDLVESRVNGLGPRPVLLRLGTDAGRLTGYLDSILRGSAHRDDHRLQRECETTHERLRQRIETLEADVRASVTLRNDVDRLERQVEALRQRIGESPFRRIRTLDPLELKRAAGLFQAALDETTVVGRPLWVRLVWPFLRKGRLQRLASARARLMMMLDAIGSEPIDGLPSRAVQVVAAAEYFLQLTTLTAQRPLEAAGTELATLTDELVANSRLLWETWLRLESSRLRPEHRKLLGISAPSRGSSHLAIGQAPRVARRSAGTLTCSARSRQFWVVGRSLPCRFAGACRLRLASSICSLSTRRASATSPPLYPSSTARAGLS
jgi:hypothetical protein